MGSRRFPFRLCLQSTDAGEIPENPNHPPQDVRWGENTTDEMCIAFLGVTLDEENLASAASSQPAQ
jgi:hypothetical protein